MTNYTTFNTHKGYVSCLSGCGGSWYGVTNSLIVLARAEGERGPKAYERTKPNGLDVAFIHRSLLEIYGVYIQDHSVFVKIDLPFFGGKNNRNCLPAEVMQTF